MKSAICVMMAAALCAPVQAQQVPGRRPLTVEWIMRGPALYGYEPRAVRWSGNGQKVYFEWKQAADPPEKEWDTWLVGRDGAGLRKLTGEEARDAPPARGAESADGKKVAFARQGDLYLYDRISGRIRRLTRTGEAETSPGLTKDGRVVTFMRGANLYALHLEDGLVEQLTDIQPAAGSGGERKDSASQESLKKEERALLDAVAKKAKQREEQEEKRKKENPRKPWKLAPRQTVTGLMLSPGGKTVLAMVRERASDAKTTQVPVYITESAYAETAVSRTKAGDAQGRQTIALVSVETGEVKWIDPGLKTVKDGKETGRAVSLVNPQWSGDGKLAVLGAAADFKDRWVFAVDETTGKTRTLSVSHDDAWVGGPGGITLGWLPGDKEVFFQAERDGWAHLYAVQWENGAIRPLTSGKWEVKSAEITPDKKHFLLITSETNPYENHLYLMPVQGGKMIKLTNQPGSYAGQLSPGGRRAAVVYSRTNQPPELYLMDVRAGAAMKRVTVSPAAEFTAYPWIDPPIAEIEAQDGVRIPAHVYKPKDWMQGGPAVIFVHGAGYLQNVHKGWSSYPREYLFHHLLMERGYVVVDLDYRGSAGHGRDWRTAVYRNMGGKDLDDQVDAAHWLVKEHGVDARRIGVYGGSYGGFITLMAMFTRPGVFAAGAALRPVTDWAHYNHPYTAAILNQPQDDPEAYRRSSPIFHAAGLEGALLICHGMADTNVHFQDTVRLAQKLIELGKDNWEVAIYPVEDHGFVQAASWSDEYKRILKLFDRELKK